MTPGQLDRIPDDLLGEEGTRGLRDWLWDRGWSMSLAELDAERRQRNIRPRKRRSHR